MSTGSSLPSQPLSLLHQPQPVQELWALRPESVSRMGKAAYCYVMHCVTTSARGAAGEAYVYRYVKRTVLFIYG